MWQDNSFQMGNGNGDKRYLNYIGLTPRVLDSFFLSCCYRSTPNFSTIEVGG
jgi:hypothetical protein